MMIAGSFSSDLVFILYKKVQEKRKKSKNHLTWNLLFFIMPKHMYNKPCKKWHQKDRLPKMVDGLLFLAL